jgi:hypothetical protein
MILGATDQKLWVFKVFRRSLGRAGMCWKYFENVFQPARVDHRCKYFGQVEKRSYSYLSNFTIFVFEKINSLTMSETAKFC